MVFGNNIASDISKFFKMVQCLEIFLILQDGIIVKYHVQVMLLFVYNRSREIFGNAQETSVSLRFEKQTQASAFVTIFSRPNIQPRLSSFDF